MLAGDAGVKRHLLKQLQDGRDCAKAASELQKLDLLRSWQDYATLICALGRQSLWGEVLESLKSLRCRSLSPDAITYTAAMGALARGQQWELSLELLRETKRHRAPASTRTYAAALTATEKGRQWQHALALLQEMAHLDVEANVIIYNIAISACEKGEQWEYAFALLCGMKHKTLQQDIITYNAVITACGKSQKWELAVSMLQEIQEAGNVEADVVTFNAAITAAGKGQQWELTLSVLRHMRYQNVAMNIVSYNSALSGLEKGEQWERVLQILLDMDQVAVHKDVITYSIAISALGKGRQWQDALHMLCTMQALSINPNLITYNAAISAFEKSSEWEHALGIFQVIRRKAVHQDRVTYNAAISACESGQQWIRALGLLQAMLQNSVLPDLVTYNAAISACEKGAQMDKSLYMLQNMRGQMLQPNVVSYNAAMLSCSNAFQWERVLALLDETLECRIMLDLNSFSMLMMNCEQHRLIDREFAILGDVETLAHYDGGFLAGVVANAVALRAMVAKREAQAALILRTILQNGSFNVASMCLYGMLQGTVADTLTVASGCTPRTTHKVVRLPAKSPYSKELSLLQHVLERARPLDAASVCATADSFGEEVFSTSGTWSKFAGGVKAEVLSAACTGAPPRGRVLEIGTYCGYSAVRMAMALPEVCILTLEVDPIHVVVARNMIIMAGLSSRVDVWTGHSKYVLARLSCYLRNASLRFSAVFMDRWASQYGEDFDLISRHGLLQPGALVIADNLLRTGGLLYMWKVHKQTHFTSQLVRVREFGMHAEDWMSVTVQTRPARRTREGEESGAQAPDPPSSVCQLHLQSERMRERAFGPGRTVTLSERSIFSEKVYECLVGMGIAVLADASDAPD